MFACQRIALSTSKRQFHTLPAILAESEGLFGKFNPWANKNKQETVSPAQHTTEEPTKVTFNVKYQDAEDVPSWKRKDVLTNEAEIESTVKSVILAHVEGATETNWTDLPIQDLKTKFNVLKESIKETGKDVPNYELNGLSSTKDVLAYFKTGGPLSAQKVTIQSYFEENSESLPKNLTFVPRE
jgi:hypothetical protein